MEIKDIKKNYKEELRTLKRKNKDEKADAHLRYIHALECYYEQNGKKLPQNPPKRPLLEEIGNSVTHGLGAIFAIVALLLMLLGSKGANDAVGALVYSLGALIMFSVSCLYHAFPHGSAVKRLFRRFDYSCIYLLIGATFAPLLLSAVGGALGLIFFIIQWAAIATGITMVGVFGPSRLRWLHIPLYLILGWAGIILLPNMYASCGIGLVIYILVGGVVYSLGLIPFVLKKGPSHFIWHFFVLAGCIVQWLGIYLYIYA